jgi:hypothetical protein
MFEILKRHPKPEREYSPAEIESLLFNSLGRVGKDKPLGYLPIGVLTDICKVDIDELKDELEARGLMVLGLNEKESSVMTGALFAYDFEALSRVLKSGRQVLERSGWPTEPEAFVRHLNIVVRENPDLYALIEDAYGDLKSKKQ